MVAELTSTRRPAIETASGLADARHERRNSCPPGRTVETARRLPTNVSPPVYFASRESIPVTRILPAT